MENRQKTFDQEITAWSDDIIMLTIPIKRKNLLCSNQTLFKDNHELKMRQQLLEAKQTLFKDNQRLLSRIISRMAFAQCPFLIFCFISGFPSRERTYTGVGTSIDGVLTRLDPLPPTKIDSRY
nr:hypothetical protein [Tanacetum cinerariifolium]